MRRSAPAAGGRSVPKVFSVGGEKAAMPVLAALYIVRVGDLHYSRSGDRRYTSLEAGGTFLSGN